MVGIRREQPAKGTWRRYDGRRGKIVAVNRAAADYVEVGVDFDGDGKASAWFLPSEVTVLGPGRPQEGRK